MDKDRIAGSAKVVKGKIKEVAGKAVGDSKLETEGSADQVKGKIQNAIGGVKDALKERVSDLHHALGSLIVGTFCPAMPVKFVPIPVTIKRTDRRIATYYT